MIYVNANMDQDFSKTFSTKLKARLTGNIKYKLQPNTPCYYCEMITYIINL